MQNTSHLLMIRPVHFGYNPQTAVNNAFQLKGEQAGVQEKALHEFDVMADLLRSHGTLYAGCHFPEQLDFFS